MQLFEDNKRFKLYQGNMLELDTVIEKNSIDSIVTDPPYELNFMGKGWDNSGIAFQSDTWKKCLEVLKPGGYLLAFGGSRTFHRITCAIEDAGFEIRDTIMWLYGSGFPKSMDISKQIDKKGGNDYSKEFAKDLKQARESRKLTMKYCDDKYCGGTTNWSWYEGRPKGMRVPDYDTYLKITKDFPELEKYKELIKEAEREVIGTTITNKTVYQNVGGKNVSGEIDITIPSTNLAKQWQGWGTALKPSYEPIIVARKPCEGSCVDNVLKYGVGGINIDECRIATSDNWHRKETETNTAEGYQRKNKSMYAQKSQGEMNENGRFPANIILTYNDDDFQEVCGGFPISKSSGNETTHKDFSKHKGSMMHNSTLKEEAGRYENGYVSPLDSGSAARYFYCAKASKRDRDEGLEHLESKLYAQSNGSQLAISKGEEYHKDGIELNQTKLRKNIHPTVKPTTLMQYLVRLVTPRGGTVLDPFNGSGSTGKAVMFENVERQVNYKYVGIELSEEYLTISVARIKFAIGYEISELKAEEKSDNEQLTFQDFWGNEVIERSENNG